VESALITDFTGRYRQTLREPKDAAEQQAAQLRGAFEAVVIAPLPQPWAESAIPSTAKISSLAADVMTARPPPPAPTGGVQHFVVEQSVNTAAVSHIVRPCWSASTRARRMGTRS
jgi:hypothetical protein